MWLRGEVFDHGMVKISIEQNCGSETPMSPCGIEGNEHSLWGPDYKGFELLGNVVAGLNRRQLGAAVGELRITDCQNILLSEWWNVFGEGTISELECRALVQIFTSIISTSSNTSECQENSTFSDSPKALEAKFALFLLLQGLREMKTRHQVGKEDITVWLTEQESFVETSQEDPLDSPILKSPRTLALDSISRDHESHLEFVRSKVKEICWFLNQCETPMTKESFISSWNEQTIPVELLEALTFIIQPDPASDGSDRTFSDYFAPQQDIPCPEIESVLQKYLVANDELNPPLHRLTRDGTNHISVSHRVSPQSPIDNGFGIPNSPLSPHLNRSKSLSSEDDTNQAGPVVVISNLSRKTYIYGDVDLISHSTISTESNSSTNIAEKMVGDTECGIFDKLIVFDCVKSSIYALRPFKFVRIVGCKQSTIVLGPCSGVVTLEHCSDVKLIGVSRYLTVANCYDSKVHVQLLDGSPILSGDCRNIAFGPFNTFYPRLNLHLATISNTSSTESLTQRCLWKTPIDITVRVVPRVWSMLPPEDFTLFVSPFLDPSLENPCVELPFRLPPEYTQAVQAKAKSVEKLIQDVSQAVPGCGASQSLKKKQDLERAIQGMFKDWLVTSGNIRQLVDLVKSHSKS